MKVQKLTRTFMLRTAGVDPAKAPSSGGGIDIWTPIMILSGSQSANRSHLVKSITDNVNDNKKRASYLQMIDALFRAITVEEFSAFFRGSLVTYKKAHSFKFQGKNEILHELKSGKKDRIYIYPYKGSLGKLIFVLEVLHKDQQHTPDEIKRYAETAIKNILEAKVIGPIN